MIQFGPIRDKELGEKDVEGEEVGGAMERHLYLSTPEC